MANYANLLAQIAANIYSNNNQEITGDALQLQLNAMVASLGAGYQFMGVAHPTDTPSGYADLRAFWLAGDTGTYTNFGGLVLNDGEVAILKYNGSWSKEVTGAATAAQLTELGQEVSDNTENIVNLQQEIDAIQPIVIEGNVTNAPDEEDITTDENDLLKFADRPTALNQMGYKILRKDATFAEQVTKANTIYEIRYDFDLGGASVTIPAGCVLKFVGGKLSNGAIVGNGTDISWDGNPCFTAIAISGTWSVANVYAKMFSDIQSENVLREAFNLCKGSTCAIYIDKGLECVVSVATNNAPAIEIPGDTFVHLDGEIRLKANSLWGYGVVKISEENVHIVGSGKVLGDYLRGHDFSTYQGEGHDTHEWGRGVWVQASNVTIEGIEVSNCTGDAFNVGNFAIGVTLDGIYGHTSRRQGLTIGNVENFIVRNFRFENINGIDPKSAIDIEPNDGNVRDVIIANGIIKNCVQGIVSFQASGKVGEYKNIKIENVHFESLDDAVSLVANSSHTIFNVENITYTKISRLLLSAGVGTSIIAKNVIELYDETDPADDFPQVIINARSGGIVSLSNFKGRTRRDWYADSSNTKIIVTDSELFVYENKTGSYVGIHAGCDLTMQNCKVTKSASNMGIYFHAGPGLIEGCSFDVSGINIQSRIAGAYNYITLRNNDIQINGDWRNDHQGMVVQEGYNASMILFLQKNRIAYSGTTYMMVLQDGAFAYLQDNSLSAPNSTIGSFINNVPTKWNNLSQGLRKGTTSNRPTLKTSGGWITFDEGYRYFDTTLKCPIWWDGSAWVNSKGINMAGVTAIKGATATRTAMSLNSLNAGFAYYDTDLKKWVLWNGTAWVNMDGTALA